MTTTLQLKTTWVALALGLGAVLGGAAQAADPDEDAIFGGEDEGDAGEEDAIFGDAPERPGSLGEIVVPEDPLAIGGQLYLRFMSTVSDRGGPGEQRLAMPNLLDLYLDARPEGRVRGFVSGRLGFDPTVDPDEAELLGQSRESISLVLDQMWIKTDIARAVFLTIGQERIKWGASRLWNPNDFVNQRRRDPLALFDERTGVPMLKVHVPHETLNFYLIGLLGEASRLDEPGVAFRFEAAFAATEIALSGIAGKGRKTAFGFDISSALGELDFTAEVSLSDERDTLEYFDEGVELEGIAVPGSRKVDAWQPRVSAGLQYAFKPNDDDVMYLGLEYFWNPLGEDDHRFYPWRIVQGDFEPFYLGQHYLGFTWVVPQPGCWDDSSFTLSALGNLSDTSFITRLDFSQTLHTKLRLEAYAQAHYGTRGGEFRFALDVPELPPIPEVLPDGSEAFSLPAPAVVLGLNLRISI